MFQSRPLDERLWEKVQKTEGCWIWTGSTSKGYGYIRVGKKNKQVHRVAYELLVGPIPKGLTLDHVKANGCTSKACVKAIADEFGPAHLEPVTMRVNGLRGNSIAAQNDRKTHCLRGHLLSGDNVRIDTQIGGRVCRACRRLTMERYHARQAAS